MIGVVQVRKILCVTLLFILCGTTAYADMSEKGVTSALSGNTVTVTGVLAASDNSTRLTLEVLNAGYSFGGSLAGNALLHVNQIKTGTDKAFTFSFAYGGDSGVYKACVNGNGFSVPFYFDLRFVKLSDYTAAAEAVNQAADVDLNALKAVLDEDTKFFLGFDTIAIAGADAGAVTEMLYKYLRTSKLPTAEIEFAPLLWKQLTVIDALNKGLISDMSKTQGMLMLDDAAKLKWYGNIAGDSSAVKRLAELLSKKNFSSYADYEKAFRTSLVLTNVQYPNGYANIGYVLNDFSDITGITKSGENEIYKKIQGKYDSIPALKAAYDAAANGGGGGGGTGSGGGGGGAAGSPDYGYTVPPAPVTAQKPTIAMRFADLDTVAWAYEAISTLTDKNIINGISETEFAPEEPVKREEFIKLIVCALGIEPHSSGVYFADAAADKWFSGYVNAAHEKGICRGFGNGLFGAGELITRQDMSVMLYNAMLTAGFSGSTSGLTFDDSGSVADYAVEAVSALVSYGAVNGVGGNLFAPNDFATRAEAAKMIFGVLDILEGGRT